MIMDIVNSFFLVMCGYLLGNINFAKVISRLKKDDITKHGSGNPGSMNMLRTFGLKTALLTLFFDALKSAIPSLVGFYMFGGDVNSAVSYTGLFIGGTSAVIGHCFPVAYGFKGGKGVASMLGMYAVAEPYWALAMFGICFLYLVIFDYGALASFLFITVLTLIEGYKFHSNIIISIILFIVYFLVWFMHRGNINRLLIGKENRVNFIDKLKKVGKKKEILNKNDYSKQELKEIKKQNKQQQKLQKKQQKIEEKEREIG